MQKCHALKNTYVRFDTESRVVTPLGSDEIIKKGIELYGSVLARDVNTGQWIEIYEQNYGLVGRPLESENSRAD